MKILKSVLPLFIMGLSYSVNAQTENKTNGIYLSEKDFISHNITYPVGKGDKMHLNEFFGSSYLSIGNGGYRKTLQKDDVFGYHDKGQDFRIFKRSSYQIIDTAGFIIYSGYVLVQQRKGYMPVKQYFFSETSNTDIVTLTKENLSRVFSKSPDFRYAQESYFHNDQELLAYDKIEKQYKLKHIYFKSIKQMPMPMQASK